MTNNRKFGIAMLVICSVILVVVSIQCYFNGPYSCARCGAQKWENNVLWFDVAGLDYPYDEFGIMERWLCAHNRDCVHVWNAGLLGNQESRYWPELHLLAAKGTSLKELGAAIVEQSVNELKKRDAFGRTILHWVAVHPDVAVREGVWSKLLDIGLDAHAEDEDGLSPMDWKLQCGSAEIDIARVHPVL